METWGVLRLDAGSSAATDRGSSVAAPLAARLDGVVTVATDATPNAVLAAVPSSAARIVELDADSLADPGADALLDRLIAEHDAGDAVHVAVVAAQPLADALKRVEHDGDRDVVVHGLEREGLMMPRRPHVIGRAALASALETVTAAEDADAVTVLLAAGGAVRVVPTDGAPVTVRSGARVAGAR
jgi:hypothetical protein